MHLISPVRRQTTFELIDFPCGPARFIVLLCRLCRKSLLRNPCHNGGTSCDHTNGTYPPLGSLLLHHKKELHTPRERHRSFDSTGAIACAAEASDLGLGDMLNPIREPKWLASINPFNHVEQRNSFGTRYGIAVKSAVRVHNRNLYWHRKPVMDDNPVFLPSSKSGTQRHR